MKSKLLNTNLNNYKIFYEVARVLNISLTSQNLLMTQANVSIAIKKLEDEFQVELLLRKHKGMELTLSGVILYNSLKKIFGELQSIEPELLKIKEEKHKIHV